jgi:hypothetical protein
MAFTVHQNNHASSTDEEMVSDTALAMSPAVAVPAGKLAILPVVWDNVNGTNANDTTILSVSDTKSNTWIRAAECQYSAGSALDGVLAGVYYSTTTTQIETTDTVTVTSTANGTAKGLTLASFNYDTSKTIAVAGKGYERVAAATAFTVTVSGLTNEEHLWIGLNAIEGDANNTNSSDATFTAITQGAGSNFGPTGGSLTNVGARAGYKIAVDTGETYDRTALTALDRATILVAFREVAGGGPVVTRRTLLGVGV